MDIIFDDSPKGLTATEFTQENKPKKGTRIEDYYCWSVPVLSI